MPYTKAQVAEWLARLAEGDLELEADNIGLADAALDFLGGVVVEPLPPLLPPGNVTEHFTLAEFTRSNTALQQGIDNTPNEHELVNIGRVANVLEKIRELCGDNPVTVTSGFRSEALNQAVGGVPNSAHRLGLAADFVIPAFGSPTDICRFLVGRIDFLGLDQLICEKTGGHEWVHIGLSDSPPRHQALTITDSGTQIGIV